MICPDCKGKKGLTALVDGPKYRGPLRIPCRRCNETGEVDPIHEQWMKVGGMHRTWRVAQDESQLECAKRLGIRPSELSDMEAGRSDPSRLITDTPEVLR